ncbi:glycosyltransferase family 9 protein [Helicobacter cappadocius]|uniref:Glycosyltransferase family 9 protein n=1 Tax=Helicobacter cappadocius TaxID=3063998 RepID=A0AA90T5J5_9HELI|nr:MULTISPECIES: glycosyltransferase family 9 protein [unclassified Helicobacter]MDO7253570.1 glycosyltransferase family 9 protein [Helicobacter sp. faydin-H75]MDP2539498.1 glycosyltransferase family 9 protein [Helicobacter sp. faydin-H76]
MKKITFEKSSPLRIVLFRTDRLGDSALTIQCAEAIKDTYPNSYIYFALSSYTAPLLENNPFVDEVILIDKYSQKDLISFLKTKKIDISISFFASKLATYVPFFAKIPIRIGILSKLRSIFFTHKIRQKRSNGSQNEAQYNLNLLKPLGIQKIFYPKIYLSESEKATAKQYLEKKFGDKSKNLIILHPGSGGSSKDWSTDNYLLLAQKIIEENLAEILITGSNEELQRYAQMLKNYPLISANNLLEEQKPLREFFGIIAQSKLFLSNGTGPLHCAIALDTPTMGFHTLMRSCKPSRWGPFTSNPQKHIIITPKDKNNNPLPECTSCSLKCPYYLCMDSIKVDDIYKKIKESFCL